MNEIRIPLRAIKGRGAASQMPHRFEKNQREVFDDGWGAIEAAQEAKSPPPATRIIWEDAKTAIARNDSPDIYFDHSLNPYRGCEHGCIYCYARPTHSYLGFSPGLDFETKIIAKRNIAQVLREELAKPRYVPNLISVGSATDCYQPVERELLLTRSVIELFNETRHPFGIITKSSTVERDIDLIAPLAARQLAAVYITITTLDGELARKLEPRAASPLRRLRTIKTLAEAGILVGVSLAPQIPFLNDDMEKVLEAAWEAGARRAFYTVLRLPWELGPLFKEWLVTHYPMRADRIMARIHDMRGGKTYVADFASRMKGTGLWSELLRHRFQKTTTRLGYNRERNWHDCSIFQKPEPAVSIGQGHLF